MAASLKLATIVSSAPRPARGLRAFGVHP